VSDATVVVTNLVGFHAAIRAEHDCREGDQAVPVGEHGEIHYSYCLWNWASSPSSSPGPWSSVTAFAASARAAFRAGAARAAGRLARSAHHWTPSGSSARTAFLQIIVVD
jgi:hypothetical protein